MRPLAMASLPRFTTAPRPRLRETPSATALLGAVLLLAVALVTAACSRTAKPDGPTSALQPFKRGVQAFQDEDYPRAAKLFEQAATLDERSPVIFYNLGLAYYMLEAFPESIEAYHKALKLDPKFADAHMNLALAYDRTYDLEQANAQYNEFLALVRSNRVANASESGASNGPGGAGATGSGNGGAGQGSSANASAGKGSAGNGGSGNGVSGNGGAASAARGGNPAAGGASQSVRAAPGGRGLSGSSQRVPGQPGAQPGRRPSLAAPSGPRAPIGELRRLPTDDGNPSASKSKDPTSSAGNAWWTQDAPPKTR